MFKKIKLLSLFGLIALSASAQSTLQTGSWNASLHRADGKKIIFNLSVEKENGKTKLYVVNPPEKLLIDDVRQVKDSLFINMPLFESSFKLKIEDKDSLSGRWIRRGAEKESYMPFTASAKTPYRFPANKGDAKEIVAGKWKIDIFKNNGGITKAIGEFKQTGNTVSGSILTPSGDYRYLSGIVTGNQLYLSTFDGVYAMTFNATITTDSLTNGVLYSGMAPAQRWEGKKDAQATLTANTSFKLKDGESGKLNFSFKDINGKQVSVNDERFKNKVVIIQILGSWCPNCIDETAFLSDYYKKNKARGVEIIGLAYEYSTDPVRTKYSLGKLIKRFDVEYPVLVAPVTVGDAQKTAKTLPQFTEIAIFPTTIVLGKDGKVSHVSSDFYGPGTGEYHLKYKADFENKINKLLEAK